MNAPDPAIRIDLDLLPELDTIVGLNGATIEVEVGGQVCLESSVASYSAGL